MRCESERYYPNYIFDLYGTLADIRTNENSPRLWAKTALWYREHGACWSGPEMKRRYLELCRTEQAKFDDPLAEIELKNVFGALFTEKEVSPDQRLIEETARFFRIASLRKLRLYPWVLPTFEKLRQEGSHLYLLSNAQACFTEGELRTLGLSEQFDGVILSSDAGIKKPSPAILRLLLDRFRLRTEDCLFIGNDPVSDITMAETAGMDSLYIQTETSPSGELPAGSCRVLPDEDYRKLDALLMRSE